MSMISYYTEIDIETCKKILYEKIKSESSQCCGLRGKVYFGSNKIKIYKSRTDYKQGISRAFYGKLIQKENGTIINGEFRVATEVVIYTSIWFTIAILMWLICFVDIIFETFNDNSGPLMTLIVFSIVLGLAALKIKSWYNEKEENYILYNISTNLNATFILE